jgi:adenylate kinase
MEEGGHGISAFESVKCAEDSRPHGGPAGAHLPQSAIISPSIFMSNPESLRYRSFLIFGAPGSGKGTQGAILGRIPRFIHCACGEVFRALDTRTPLGRQFVEFSSRGELVPDDLTVKLWHANIKSREESHHFKSDIDFLVLDGIPRNVGQARILDQHVEVLQVFHLSCPNRVELYRRLRKRAVKENRMDDANEETIARRLQTYEEESKPLLEYYDSGIITDIDATRHPAIVFHEILSKIISLPRWRELSQTIY